MGRCKWGPLASVETARRHERRELLQAQRLLPDDIFAYAEDGKMTSLLSVQEGAASYQRWIYNYNDKGLRIRETCYGKERDMLGHIEYQYTYK